MRSKATIFTILAGYSNIIYSIISGLVLVPFYLNDFGSEVYGVWLATGNLISWLGIMGASLSIVFAQTATVAYAKNDITGFRELVGGGIILFGLLAIILFGGVILLSDAFLSMFEFKASEYDTIKSALTYSALASSIAIIQSLITYILGAWFVNAPLMYGTLIGGAVGILVNITLLYYGFGLLSIPLGMVARAVVIIILLYWSASKEWRLRQLGSPIFKLKTTRNLTVQSGPILLSNLTSIGLNHSQSTVIGLLFGPSAATVVSLTDKLYGLVKTFIYPVGNAFLQPLSSMYHEKETFEKVSKNLIQHFYLIALVAVMVCFIFNKAFISLWVGDEYYGGPWVSAALAFSAILIIRVNLVITTLNAKGAFKTTSLYTIVDLVLRITFLIVLYYVIWIQNIAILPIAECIGILIGTKLIMSRHLPKGSDNINWPVYSYFFAMIILGFLKISFESLHYFIDGSIVLMTIIFFVYLIRKIVMAGTVPQVVAQIKRSLRISG